MARVENTRSNNKPEETPVIPEQTAPELSFEDAETMPDSKEISATKNPFQAKVNELARSGKAASVVLPAERGDWARDQIRRAANNISKGARTKVQPIEGDKTKVKVWFTVKEKTPRKSV